MVWLREYSDVVVIFFVKVGVFGVDLGKGGAIFDVQLCG